MPQELEGEERGGEGLAVSSGKMRKGRCPGVEGWGHGRHGRGEGPTQRGIISGFQLGFTTAGSGATGRSVHAVVDESFAHISRHG